MHVVLVPIVTLIIVVIGGWLLSADPKTIMRFDPKAGGAMYFRILARGGSEEEAMAPARALYKALGLAFVVGGLGFGVLTMLIALGNG